MGWLDSLRRRRAPAPFPTFRYHPDPIGTGSVIESDLTCLVCEQARGFLYTAAVYAEEELADGICPWCIADGSAFERFGATFTDTEGIGGGDWDDVSSEVRMLVATRTPGFSGWQQERWYTCCGDAAAFIGFAGRKELEALGPAALDVFRRESGYDDEQWAHYLIHLRHDGDATAYLFRCLHCAAYGGYSDCS